MRVPPRCCSGLAPQSRGVTSREYGFESYLEGREYREYEPVRVRRTGRQPVGREGDSLIAACWYSLLVDHLDLGVQLLRYEYERRESRDQPVALVASPARGVSSRGEAAGHAELPLRPAVRGLSMTIKCSRCGSDSLEPGGLTGFNSVAFRPDNRKFLTLHEPTVPVLAHMCRSCGALELTGALPDLLTLVPEAGGTDHSRTT